MILLALLLPLTGYLAFSTTFAEGTMSQDMRAQIAMACAAEKFPTVALMALADADFDPAVIAAECVPTWSKAVLYAGKTGSVPGAGAPAVRSTRERAYLAAMKSTLRNVVTMQESHFQQVGRYASASDPEWYLAEGVTIEVSNVTEGGYEVTATHNGTPLRCYLAYGSAAREGKYPGEPWCD